MLKIIGHKIIMEQGEDAPFRVIVRDNNGKIVTLSKNDVITLRIRRRDKPNIVLSKDAVSTFVIEESGETVLYHIITFNHNDTKNIPFGDYMYDVILETNGKRFTIVPNSSFILEECKTVSSAGGDSDSSVILFDPDEVTEFLSILSPTPLIGKFTYVSYTQTSDPADDLIVF